MFSRPDRKPLQNLSQDRIMPYAGNTATWRLYVSASAGIPEAGIGSALYYREQTITAVFGQMLALGRFMEYQMGGGQEAAGQVMMTSPYKIGRQDEIVWRGVNYRVEADPVPAKMIGHWQVVIKRADE